MGLLTDLKERYRVISIIGMVKNAGKTTALNYLIEEAMDEGIKLGITSTGRDGETVDVVTGTDKPKVYAHRGTIVTVPTSLYAFAEAGLEIVKMTDFWTSIGQLMLCRVAESGYVQIAGPVAREQQKKLCNEIKEMGVDMILIDGAVDRKSVAAPDASDAVIISTGAALSRSQKKCIEETAHMVHIYRIPQLENREVREKIRNSIHLKKILVIGEDGIKPLELLTGIGAGKYLDQAITDETQYIYIPGAFTESVIEDVNPEKFKKATFVLKDPTRFFIDSASWAVYLKKGVKVCMMEHIEIAAITVNPYAPLGYSFHPAEFQYLTQAAIADIPVINVRRA